MPLLQNNAIYSLHWTPAQIQLTRHRSPLISKTLRNLMLTTCITTRSRTALSRPSQTPIRSQHSKSQWPTKAPSEAISYHTAVGSDTKNGLRKAFYSCYELWRGVACSIVMHRILYHIHMILLCWSWLWYKHHWVHVIYVPIFFRVNTLGPRQNGHHFADTFKCISLNENFLILNEISLNYVS